MTLSRRCLMSSLLITVLLQLSACRDKVKSRDFTVTTTLKQYADARSRASALASLTTLRFPELEIYNASSQRVYDRAGVYPDPQIMHRVLALAVDQPNEADAPSLTRFIGAMNGRGLSSSDSAFLLQSHLPLVVSTALDGCSACSLQEGNVQSVKNVLKQNQINLLEIHVSPP